MRQQQHTRDPTRALVMYWTPIYIAYTYALVGGAISIRDSYICAVSLVCANESHAVFHAPIVCTVKT